MMVSLVLLVIARTARIACGLTDRQTHTHTQDNYCNPHCACVPRGNKSMNCALIGLELEGTKDCTQVGCGNIFRGEHSILELRL